MTRLLPSLAARSRMALHGPRLGALPAVVLGLLLAGCTSSAAPDTTSPSVTSPSVTPPWVASLPSTSPIDTANWIPYLSKQFSLSLNHPPGWTVTPAEHDWTLEADAGVMESSGQDGFSSPNGNIYVTVFSTPIRDTPETLDGVAAWVEKYCQTKNASCSGRESAVPLCNERKDCHPGLLVTVDGRFYEAFFTGGFHRGKMVGVLVHLADGHESLEPYGGTRRLLEGFLSTLDVFPARPDQIPPG
ncbi:MAG TPA: hypothetical protein VLR88_03425 [Propionibacteriaceae bacterium]|nr:hypothetical protein [Propionibacteriaceae bacterium]